MDRICAAVVDLGVFDVVEQVGVPVAGRPEVERAAGGFVRRRIRGGQQGARGLIAKAWTAMTWSARVVLSMRGRPVACVNAHSLAVLPLAVLLKRLHGAKLIYDTHELETETVAARGLRRPLMRILERMLIGQSDAVSVVSPSISSWYAARYGIPMPIVVRNVPIAPSAPPASSSRALRDRFAIGDAELVFLYQGLLGRGRLVDEFLVAFAGLTGRHLVVMGFGPLEQEVREAAEANPNIHFLPAVPPDEVLAVTAGADVGLCGVADVCLSYHLSLPNKIFEYFAAGVPTLAPGLPDIATLVRETGAGWVLGAGVSWRARIESITTDEIGRARIAARRAGAVHVWANEVVKVRSVYGSALGREELR